MRKILFGAASLAAFTSAALAADLPSRRAPPVYVPPPPPAFTWTGVYIGFNAGADFNGYTDYALAATNGVGAGNLAIGERTPFRDTRKTGFAGGGQIGYNFQLNDGLFGNFAGAIGNGISPIFGGNYGGVVAGVEADIAGTTNRATGIYTGAATGEASIYRSRTDFVGTARGRIGYAFGNLLIFGTGGFAYAGVHDNVNLLDPTGATAGFAGTGRIQTGVAYGGGIEYAVPTGSLLNFFHASAVTVKAEFIHYDLTPTTVAVATTLGSTYAIRIHNDGSLARLGVNYKFGSPVAAPVVARY